MPKLLNGCQLHMKNLYSQNIIRVYLRVFVTLTVVIVLIGITYEKFAQDQALIDFPPTGKLVDIGERKIHLDCRGYGSPIVVFESGLDTSGSLSWSMVHDKVAKTTRACAYDRAGMMWSDTRSNHQELLGKAIAEDLYETLSSADEKPPYVS